MRRFPGLAAAVAALLVLTATPAGAARPLPLTGDLGAHDPALVVGRGGADWYVFSTGHGPLNDGTIIIRSSRDGRHWRFAGTVWDRKPAWLVEAIPGVDNLWAPDIHRDPATGVYYLYYSASTFGSQRSLIGLATNRTLDPADPDYAWVDRGPVFESFVGDNYNAIDPGIVTDERGTRWLVFGSFWNGINLLELAWPSGKPAPGAAVRHIADRRQPPNAIEAPYIVRRGGWYYLFVSLDFCCRGVDSTYKIAVGRSRSVSGPYLDRAGVPLLDGGGTVLLATRDEAVAAGGQSYSAGFLGYHSYGPYGTPGDFRLEIEKVRWTRDGWPQLRP